MNQLHELHGVPFDQKNVSIRTVDLRRLQGADADFNPSALQIRVGKKGRGRKASGEERFNLYHEIGHWLDYDTTDVRAKPNQFFGQGRNGTFRSYSTKNKDNLVAMSDFTKTVADQTSVLDVIGRKKDRDFVQYLLSPEEVWARAYSQYVANVLEDEGALKYMERLRKRSPGFQWDDDEFEVLVPKIENVLRAWGMIE